MTFLDARAQYRRAETGDALAVESPHAIILVTLRELEKSLRILAAAEPERSYPAQHVNRAFTAIYILQSSLDFEKAQEISTNLFTVYEYCRLRVAEAFRREPSPRLSECADHIAGLVAAWQEMGTKPAARGGVA
jgi:flagellar protein FliS